MKEAGLIDYIYKSSLLNATRCTMKESQSGQLRALAFWDFAGMFSLYVGGKVLLQFYLKSQLEYESFLLFRYYYY